MFADELFSELFSKLNSENINNDESLTLKDIIIKEMESEGYTYDKETDTLVHNSTYELLTSDYIDELVKLREERRNTASDVSIISAMNINRLVNNWSVKCVFPSTCLVDDEDYFDAYDFIDVAGFSNHKFYECKTCNDYRMDMLNDHAKLIVNLVLTDIEYGLFNVDFRVKQVQSLFRYMSSLFGYNIPQKVMEIRHNIKQLNKELKLDKVSDTLEKE